MTAMTTKTGTTTYLVLALLMAMVALTVPAPAPAQAAGGPSYALNPSLKLRLLELEREGKDIKYIAISKEDADTFVILHGRNGFSPHNIPSDLNTLLHRLNARRAEIRLVEFGHNNSWVVVWDRNIWQATGGTPQGMMRALQAAYNSNASIDYLMLTGQPGDTGYFVASSARSDYSLPNPLHDQVDRIAQTYVINAILLERGACIDECSTMAAYAIIFDGSRWLKLNGCCSASLNLNTTLAEISRSGADVRVGVSGHNNNWAIFYK